MNSSFKTRLPPDPAGLRLILPRAMRMTGRAGFVLFVFCVLATAAQGQTREWTGTTGSWFESGNWSGGALPSDADRAAINNGGTAQITAAGAVADTLALADAFASSGFLEVSGADATLSVDGISVIGRSGPASMTVNAGAAVTFDDSVTVGNNPGTTATLDISGSNTSMSVGSFIVGRLGPGIAVVTNGATLSSDFILIARNSPGQLSLSGAGTVLTTASFLGVEGNPPAGPGNPTLLISEGAAFNMTDPDNSFVSIERGLVRVTDTGSEWTVAAFFSVGDGGAGTVTVSDGGRIAVGDFSNLGRFGGDVGEINIGEGGAPGVFDVAGFNTGGGSGIVNFNHDATLHHFTRDGTGDTAPVTLDNNISVNHIGPGTTVLAGNQTYSGATTIDAGELRLNGNAISAVTVNAPGRLSGTGATTGAVTVNNNATLAPGDAGPGALGTGALTLSADAQLDFELGAPAAANDRVQVNGNLTLDGVLNLTTLPDFASGTYRLFDYSGTLTDNQLIVSGLPNDFEASVDTATPGEVKLLVQGPVIEITITPPSADFGNVFVDETSAAVQFTINNTGNQDLDVSDITDPGTPFALDFAPLTGANGADPRGIDLCSAPPFTLSPAQSCVIEATFHPTTEGEFDATFDLISNAPGSPDTVTLIGNGVVRGDGIFSDSFEAAGN